MFGLVLISQFLAPTFIVFFLFVLSYLIINLIIKRGYGRFGIHKMGLITKLPKTPSPTLARKHCTRVCVFACLIA